MKIFIAGAIIACPDIGYCAAMDDRSAAPMLRDDSALGFVDFYIVPHIGNAEMGKGARDVIDTYASVLDIRAITDDQIICVENDTVTIL